MIVSFQQTNKPNEVKMKELTKEQTDQLTELTNALIEAKKKETDAEKERIKIEESILQIVGFKEEGSETHEVGSFKITTTGKLNYKCEDLDELKKVNKDLIKVKEELDKTGCKWIRENDQKQWAKIAKYISSQPAKTSIIVKA